MNTKILLLFTLFFSSPSIIFAAANDWEDRPKGRTRAASLPDMKFAEANDQGQKRGVPTKYRVNFENPFLSEAVAAEEGESWKDAFDRLKTGCVHTLVFMRKRKHFRVSVERFGMEDEKLGRDGLQIKFEHEPTIGDVKQIVSQYFGKAVYLSTMEDRSLPEDAILLSELPLGYKIKTGRVLRLPRYY